MKHLFFVHSQITYIVSIKVINFLQLNHADCVFLIHRGGSADYKSFGVKVVDYPFNPQSTDSFPMFNKFWKSWAKLKELDVFINDAVSNDEFLFYTPQTYQKYLAVIYSHKRCKGFNIIEEGGGSYLCKSKIDKYYPSNIQFSSFKKILWKLNFLERLKINRSFIDEGYIQAYGLTSYSFKDFNRKIILGLPTLNDYSFGIKSKDEPEVYDNILVFDALVEAKIIDSGTLILSTLILLNDLIRQGCSILHVKYHPDQLKSNKTINLLKDLFKQFDKLKVIEIPSSISLEEVALKQNTTFFVFGSSVGLYASFYGRKVYSLCSVIEKLHPPFSKRIEDMPTIFKEKVSFI